MWYAILTGDAYVHAIVPVVCTKLLEVCVGHTSGTKPHFNYSCHKNEI